MYKRDLISVGLMFYLLGFVTGIFVGAWM